MKKINKSNTILKAWTGELPVNEKFYKDRLNICKQCPELSGNKEDLNLLQKAEHLLVGDFCTICSCPVDKKAAMKEEQCPMDPPKWPALAVLTASDEDYNVYNNSPHIANLSLSEDGIKYVIDYGEIKSNRSVGVELMFEGKYEIYKLDKTCGCTEPSLLKLSNNLFRVIISIDPNKVHGKFSGKYVYVRYMVNGKEKTVGIELRGIKK